jgi:transposase
MAGPLVPDELWEEIRPLLPRHRAKPGRRGRPPVDDRACLTGIVFVLQSGIPWWSCPRKWAVAPALPAGAACASGSGVASGSDCYGPC